MRLFKELFFLAGENKGKLKFILLLMALRGAVKIVPLVLLYLVLLELLSGGVDGKVLTLTACLALTYIVVNLWDHHLMLYVAGLGLRLSYDVRMKLGDKLRKVPLGFFVKRPTGELNTIMSEYVSRVEWFLSFVAPFLFSCLVSALVMFGLFLFLDWRMALGAASVFPLALIAFAYAERVAERVTRKREESLRRANSIIVEFIQGMPVIKVFNQVASRFRRFQEAMRDFRDKNIRSVAAVTIPSIVLLTFTGLIVVVLLPLGLHLYLKGSLSLSTFVFFIIATPSFSESLARALFGYIHTKSREGQGMEHIAEVLREKPLPEPEDDVELENFDIEFVDVSFSYNGKQALRDVSFRIPEGSVTALVGPSGAGKTTIANLIARFWDVDSGEVRIGGKNVKELRLDRLLSYIAMVFQEVILFNDTVMENIRLGRGDAADEEVVRAAKAARCHEFVENLPQGYNTLIGERGTKLSAGERQRISIARAILKDAPIVILDEATVYVDPENERLIQEAVNELTKDRTVLVIAHRLSTITAADQILVLDEGRIVERGCHEELLAMDGLYRRMWEAHTKARGWKL